MKSVIAVHNTFSLNWILRSGLATSGRTPQNGLITSRNLTAQREREREIREWGRQAISDTSFGFGKRNARLTLTSHRCRWTWRRWITGSENQNTAKIREKCKNLNSNQTQKLLPICSFGEWVRTVCLRSHITTGEPKLHCARRSHGQLRRQHTYISGWFEEWTLTTLLFLPKITELSSIAHHSIEGRTHTYTHTLCF